MGMGCENRKGKIAGYGNLVLSWLSLFLSKNVLALSERKWFFSVYTAFVIKLLVSKELSKACQILPTITFVCCSSFPVLLFSSFSSFGKRYQIKSPRLEITFIKILHWSALIPVLVTGLTLSAFTGRTCRTWTILWTERLLSKSGHGMATPELMTMTSGQWRQYGRNHKLGGSPCYEKGASGNGFLPKEKFRAPVSRQVKTLKVLKETVRWVDLSLRVQENSKEVWVLTTTLSLY